MAASSSSSIFSRYFPKAHSTYTRYSSSPVGRSAAWSWKKRRPILIGISITYFGASYLVVRQEAARRDTIHPNTYLVWKFYPGSIVEVRGPPSLSYLLGSSTAGEEPPKIMELHEAVRALKLAANDQRVRGLLGDFSTLNWPSNVQSEGLGLAQIEELMQAIYEFKVAKDLQFPSSAQLAITVEGEPSPASVSGPAAEAPSEPSPSLDITTSGASSTETQDSPAPHLPSTIAFCDTFTSQSSYLLASAFDKVYLQPSGSIPLTGISAQIPFFSRLISKLGIKVHAEARREYKSMISQFKEKDGLPPLQAQNEAQLLGELNRSVAYAIGSNRFRGTDGDDAADKVVELMGKGPYSAKEALELGLVDGLKYKGEVVKLLTGQDTGGDIGEAKKKGEAKDDDPALLKFKTLPHYARVTDRLLLSKLKDEEVIPVAVCYLRGSISAAPGDFSASTVVKGLKEAAEDEDVKAIVLRIDSGGGDVVASDSIWHAVRRAKESSGKPIIVSFGNVAASGGYYAATAADAIYASETTVTGSIGVASLRPTITRKLFDWAGVGLQTFFTGSKAQSVLHDMDEEQLKRQTQHIDETYEDFLSKVVQGRKIERDVIEDIAGGRVFTGLVAWTKTNPDALEAAEKERELHRTGGGKGEAAASLIQQVEEALGMSKPQPTGEPATSVEASKQEGGASSPQTKFKPSDELAEWDLQDVTKEGELDTRLVVMKAKKGLRAGNREGVAEQVMQGAEDVRSKVHDALQGSKDEAQPVASMASVDPAEAAHREALVANGTKSEKEEQDLAARHAQESEKTSSPYGAGLVDAIGGLSDAAALGMTLAIQAEINALMAEQGLARDAAMMAIRPGCHREVDPESGIVSLSTDMRLIRYPRERSFRERLREMNAKGDQPSLSLGGVWGTIQSEIGGMMAKSFLSYLGDNPGAFLREVAMKMELSARKEEEEMRRVKMEYGGVGGHARL